MVPRAEEETVVGHLGPDLLGPDWDEDEALRRLLADPARPIAEAMLDQRNLAGIGNLYKSELCFLAGVHPRLPVGDVPDLRRLVRRAKSALEANKERVEQTATGTPAAAGRPGSTAASGSRAAAAAPRSAWRSRARRCRSGSTYWCPTCQPG